ncbi:MAG: hypothetical protein KF912_11850 [Phycisphaeraceae bacterium]|nr:hypothetical protein [Phycisphaeraceae bacterium]MBX3367995.1 hypothetical protein [Phycisphaeraceae bacterium]QYK48096.1 MAG: hypothetical protein KF838_15055 [Phycisphaeraceae bacterium]
MARTLQVGCGNDRCARLSERSPEAAHGHEQTTAGLDLRGQHYMGERETPEQQDTIWLRRCLPGLSSACAARGAPIGQQIRIDPREPGEAAQRRSAAVLRNEHAARAETNKRLVGGRVTT